MGHSEAPTLASRLVGVDSACDSEVPVTAPLLSLGSVGAVRVSPHLVLAKDLCPNSY